MLGMCREAVIPLAVDATRQAAKTPPHHKKGRPAPTPWQQMMRSAPVWAIVVNNFAFHYAFYVVMNWLPTFFNK
jgi:ACS family sodium-dependent inorganic phosphate cotransporter